MWCGFVRALSVLDKKGVPTVHGQRLAARGGSARGRGDGRTERADRGAVASLARKMARWRRRAVCAAVHAVHAGFASHVAMRPLRGRRVCFGVSAGRA